MGAYSDPDRFRRERERILRAVPQPVVHASELPEPGAFVVREFAGCHYCLRVMRDADGQAHAFLNVCRHRGSRLVAEASGCRHRFSCPYHAWTYDNRGRLIGVPQERQGFPGLDRDAMRLARLGCTERHGWLWVQPDGDRAPDVDAALAGLVGDFEWFDAADLAGLHTDAQLLYTIFPTSALLVQSDHISWVRLEPRDAGTTHVRISTLVPADRIQRDDDLAHWKKNHDITVATLNEDFDIGEGIQAGLQSGANEALTFGRFEGALEAFNREVDSHL